MNLKYIGTIVGTYSVDGRIIVGDIPAGMKRIPAGTKLNIGFSSNFSRPYTLKKWNPDNKGAMIQLKEITSLEQARDLKEQGIFADESLMKFDKESYFIRDLLECHVFDENTGDEIGEIIDVWLLPANDVWVMKSGDNEIPLPVTDDVIKKVDIKNKRIEIEIIDGLFDLTDNSANDEEE